MSAKTKTLSSSEIVCSTSAGHRLVALFFNMQTVSVKRDDNMGRYLTAQIDFEAGQTVLEEEAQLRNEPSMHSIQFEPSKHAYTYESGVLKFAEHSCEPNCAVSIGELRTKDSSNSELVTVRLVALRNILAGERVGFNYNTSDWAFNSPFKCVCSAESCAKNIQGFSFLSEQQQYSLVQRIGQEHLSKAVLCTWGKNKASQTVAGHGI